MEVMGNIYINTKIVCVEALKTMHATKSSCFESRLHRPRRWPWLYTVNQKAREQVQPGVQPGSFALGHSWAEHMGITLLHSIK